jgi:16S rRNA processing protein RimM
VQKPDKRPGQRPAERGSDETAESREPLFLAIGSIRRPHGVRGEVVVEVFTDFPERFEAPDLLYVGDDYAAIGKRVVSSRWHQERVIIKFEDCDDRNCADMLRGQYVVVPVEQAMPLPEDTYYLHQLTGLHVVTIEGEEIGVVADILFLNANDVYVVEGPRGQILLPAIADVIQDVDLENGQMTVNLIPGLV